MEKKLKLRQAAKTEYSRGLNLLKLASIDLQNRVIDQWAYWQNPDDDKINWIKDGFKKNEFYFIEQKENIIGMVRLLNEDLLYWGVQSSKALYIHSLVVDPKYRGMKIGLIVMTKIEQKALKNNINLLRLDCVATNKGLCHYYENQGFVKVRTIQMPHSQNNLYEKII